MAVTTRWAYFCELERPRSCWERRLLAGPGDEVPHETLSVHAWAAPTSRLEAGVPSAFRGRGRPVGPFFNKGGLTMTHALLRGSPAIDAAFDAECFSVDQSGLTRPLDSDGVAICDAAAYEMSHRPIEVPALRGAVSNCHESRFVAPPDGNFPGLWQ